MIVRSDPAWVLTQIENPERAVAGDAIPWPEVAAIVQRTWPPADPRRARPTRTAVGVLFRNFFSLSMVMSIINMVSIFRYLPERQIGW